MKKIVSLLMAIIMIALMLVSCEKNPENAGESGSEVTSDSESTSGEDTESDTDTESITENDTESITESDTESDADSDMPSTDESSDESTSDKTTTTDTEKVEEFVPPADQGAKLVGFRTEASRYDGPFNSTVGWTAAGMGYFVRTENGNLIVIDGGNTEDAVKFYKLLKKYSLTEHITVDYWILTHPHSDHVNCLIEMSEYRYMMENMTIKNLVYYFPEELKNGADSTCMFYKEKFESIAEQVGAEIIQPKKNQEIELPGAKIKFLYVPSDYKELTNINQLSLIFTVTTNSKKIMFTGDAFEKSLKSVYNSYRWNSSELDCDILQMPHHFLCDTGYQQFYNKVNAETLLIPACRSGYDAMKNADEYKNNAKNKINLSVESKAENVYKAFEGDFEIDV